MAETISAWTLATRSVAGFPQIRARHQTPRRFGTISDPTDPPGHSARCRTGPA